mgnify:CR=1 FL=1
MSEHCVYWIRRPDHTDPTTQGYIGITAFFERRMKEHFKKTENRYLRNAINKYGWDNLVKEQLLIGTEEYCLEIELKLRPKEQIGWNLVKGGGKPPLGVGNKYKLGVPSWNKGMTMPPETTQKVSAAVVKWWQVPGNREFLSAKWKGRACPMKGKKHRPESIQKMALTKLGKPSKKKGIPLSAEQIEKMRQMARENSWECPHCSKFGYSIGARNRWHFDNCKFKITSGFVGEQLSFLELMQ